MSIMELGALGEFVGAFTVVATLLYVGFQVRQNTKAVRGATILSIVFLYSGGISADERVEKDVVYGMHSGLALTLDIYYPAESNKHALLMIPGSA